MRHEPLTINNYPIDILYINNSFPNIFKSEAMCRCGCLRWLFSWRRSWFFSPLFRLRLLDLFLLPLLSLLLLLLQMQVQTNDTAYRDDSWTHRAGHWPAHDANDTTLVDTARRKVWLSAKPQYFVRTNASDSPSTMNYRFKAIDKNNYPRKAKLLPL